MSDFEYRHPMLTPEMNLEIAIGGIKFRDATINNLRKQIEHLRTGLECVGIPVPLIDEVQYAHLRTNAE